MFWYYCVCKYYSGTDKIMTLTNYCSWVWISNILLITVKDKGGREVLDTFNLNLLNESLIYAVTSLLLKIPPGAWQNGNINSLEREIVFFLTWINFPKILQAASCSISELTPSTPIPLDVIWGSWLATLSCLVNASLSATVLFYLTQNKCSGFTFFLDVNLNI